MATHAFHSGEIGAQTRVGVACVGARVARGCGDAPSPRALDLSTRPRLAVVAGTDAGGAVWASPLRGAPGLRGHGGGALEIATGFPPGDPLGRVFALSAPIGVRELPTHAPPDRAGEGTSSIRPTRARVTADTVTDEHRLVWVERPAAG